MSFTIGFFIIIVVGFLQGTFILPMTYTKKWNWAHNWFEFSLLGMLVLNWIIALLFIPNLTHIISVIPFNKIVIVLAFGFIWGIGAILFGKGMDLLGMALGYPIIMGINASVGSIIPAIIYTPTIFLQPKGILLIMGSFLIVIGILFCGKAADKKYEPNANNKFKFSGKGLIIAIAAGFTSCLPNIGFALSSDITDLSIKMGVSENLAGNVIWSLFFTAGFIANAGYCLLLMHKEGSFKLLINEYKTRNWILIFSMSLMWIVSFYFYGIGTSMLGKFGLTVGWPIFVSLSIIVGNFWGIKRGEWKDTTRKSKQLLSYGLVILVISVIVLTFGK